MPKICKFKHIKTVSKYRDNDYNITYKLYQKKDGSYQINIKLITSELMCHCYDWRCIICCGGDPYLYYYDIYNIKLGYITSYLADYLINNITKIWKIGEVLSWKTYANGTIKANYYVYNKYIDKYKNLYNLLNKRFPHEIVSEIMNYV